MRSGRLEMAAPPTKQYLLPLIFFILISFSFVFLFSISSPSRNSRSQTKISRIPGPNTPRSFTFIIKVLTYNRLYSLVRCLNSLSRAHYDHGDRVHLHVFIDNFRKDSETPSADRDERLKISREILDFVDGFSWGLGEKLVHFRTSNAGLQAQWIESWWPSSDHEFAFVVEDDLEVSPLYYRFLKAIILNYYYNSSNFSPYVYGASLQRPRFVPGKHGNKMNLDGEDRIFLYQLVGTWGQLLFPRPWKEFRLWYDVHKAKDLKPFLDGMVIIVILIAILIVAFSFNFALRFVWIFDCFLGDKWMVQEVGEKIWTPWFIKFIHSHGYFNFYTNFLNKRALSISHRDTGANYRKTAGPDSSLIDATSVDPNFLELPPLSSLKWYDFCFKEIVHNRIIKSSKELQSLLRSTQKSNHILLVSIYRTQEGIISNMLCHFQRLHIRNYLLIGPSSSFLLELARRGHPVVDASHFSDFTQLSKSQNHLDTSTEQMKENVVKAFAVKKSLELGYTTWLLDGYLLPLNEDSFFDSFDFSIGRSSGLLFLKSSPSMSRIWTNNLVYNVASEALSVKEHAPQDTPFLVAVDKLLREQNIKLASIDAKMVMPGDIATNTTSFIGKSKFISWPDKSEIDTIQEQLERLGLWVVDSDSSCTAVVCQQQ